MSLYTDAPANKLTDVTQILNTNTTPNNRWFWLHERPANIKHNQYTKQQVVMVA